MDLKNSPWILLIFSVLFQLLFQRKKAVIYKNLAGKRYRDIGELSVSRKIHKKVIAIARKNEFWDLLLEATIDLGTVERDLGHSQDAEKEFIDSLEKARKSNEVNWEAESLRSLAFLYLKLGRLQDAEKVLTEASTIRNKITNQRILANLLAVFGNYYHHIGDITRSLQSYEEALLTARKSGFTQRVATVLGDLGVLYLAQGLNDSERSRFYLLAALEESYNAKYVKSTLSIIWRLADLEEKSFGNLDKAREYYLESYRLANKTEFKREQADSLVGIGNIEWSRNHQLIAFQKYLEAKKIYEDLGYKKEAAYLFEKEGDLLVDQGMYTEAVSKYESACSVFEELVFIENLWYLHDKAGIASEKSGAYVSAYYHYEKAIKTIEQMRSQIPNESQKLTFITRRLSVFERIVLLCLRLNSVEAEEIKIAPLEKAFEFIERAKSRTLIDMLGNVRINIDDVSDSELQSKREVLEKRLDNLVERARQEPPSIRQRKAFVASQKEIVSEYHQTYLEWQEIIEVLRKQHPEFLSLKQVDLFTVEDFWASFYSKMKNVLLDYYFADNHIVILLLKQNEIISHVVKIKISDLELQIENFLNELTNVSYKGENEILRHIKIVKQIASVLYNELLLPVEKHFKNNELLFIVPHGKLHILPFHALYDQKKGKYLGEMLEISYLPSASILRFCKEKNKGTYTKFLGIGNPTTLSDLSELPGAEAEVKNIASLYEISKVLIREEATKDNFYYNAINYDIIHIACHGAFYSDFPLLSQLFLARSNKTSGILTAADVFNLRLDCSLVVLSACESGIGKILSGDEILGFIRAFLFAGAPTMLVSLWPIADKATQNFMVDFHKQLLICHSKTKAMKKTINHFVSDPGLYQHPFFWAGFNLVGDNE